MINNLLFRYGLNCYERSWVYGNSLKDIMDRDFMRGFEYENYVIRDNYFEYYNNDLTYVESNKGKYYITHRINNRDISTLNYRGQLETIFYDLNGTLIYEINNMIN